MRRTENLLRWTHLTLAPRDAEALAGLIAEREATFAEAAELAILDPEAIEDAVAFMAKLADHGGTNANFGQRMMPGQDDEED